MSADITQFLFQPAGSPVKHKVRTVARAGEPWFVLADVCSVLEISNPSMAAARLDEDEKHTLSNVEGIAKAQVQSFTIINESGLWSLVLNSRKPEAKAFKKWLTSEVIPSLRKHGGYIVGEEKLSTAQTPEDLDSINEVIQAALQRKTDMLEARAAQQALLILEQAPKVVTYDTHVAGEGLMKVHLYAGTLGGVNTNKTKGDLFRLKFLHRRVAGLLMQPSPEPL